MRAKKYTKETILLLDVQERPTFDVFNIGDMVAVSQVIVEEGKKRVQVFEGNVIARHNKGISSTFTVRKIGANGVAIERIFPYYLPTIQAVKCVKQGDVRRAKLYYVRDRIGRDARIKEKIVTKQQRLAKEEQAGRESKAAE